MSTLFAPLKRHPIPMEAFFRYSLVLTYALPEELLAPLLPPGLTLDAYEGNGLLAIALVQTEKLRPAGWPAALGRDFFLSGYRIFARYRAPGSAGPRGLRGLRILRSDADSALMVTVGNLLTHYHYRRCRVDSRRSREALDLTVSTPNAEADLAVHVDLLGTPTGPPLGSPFPDLATARRFAGPLPHTFDYEAETHSMVIIEGVRTHWQPRPVNVTVERCTFFDSAPFRGAPRVLANAFFVEEVPYRWERGVLSALGPAAGNDP